VKSVPIVSAATIKVAITGFVSLSIFRPRDKPPGQGLC
jgi:hypothetical protein